MFLFNLLSTLDKLLCLRDFTIGKTLERELANVKSTVGILGIFVDIRKCLL